MSVAANNDELERIRIFKKTAAASMAVWSFKEIDMVSAPDQVSTTVERLNTDLMAYCEQVFAHATVQSEFHGA